MSRFGTGKRLLGTVIRDSRSRWKRLRTLSLSSVLGVIRSVSRRGVGIDLVSTLGIPVSLRMLSPSEKTVLLTPVTRPTTPPSSPVGAARPEYIPEKREPEAFVARLSGGISTDGGYNMDMDGCLLPETSVEFQFKTRYPDWNPDEEFDVHDYSIWEGVSFRPSIRQFDCCVATLTTRWQNNFYHWLFEVLPRLHLLDKATTSPDLLYASVSLPFQGETLRALGFASSSLIDSTAHPYLCARELLVPSLPGITGFVPDWVCDFLREKFLPESPDEVEGESPRDKPRVIYVSRQGARHRTVRNEDAVQMLLTEVGASTVLAEELSFSEQVSLFHQADVVVAPHGAGLSNLVFCRPGTSVVEVFGPSYLNPCFWFVSQAVGLDYHYLIGAERGVNDATDRSWGQRGAEDIEVPVDQLRDVIASVCRTWNENAGTRGRVLGGGDSVPAAP